MEGPKRWSRSSPCWGTDPEPCEQPKAAGATSIAPYKVQGRVPLLAGVQDGFRELELQASPAF